MKPINFQILGVGAWGQGFESWQMLSQILSSDEPTKDSEQEFVNPKPEIIPANERRRAPLSVRLAVETSWQAVQQANISPQSLPCVFVSGLGDTDLTDYLCKSLAKENKALSPTKFHNSVHNAPAGYWTISTNCTQAANSIAAYQESTSMALLEALLQCQIEQQAILISFYDAPSSTVLLPLLKNQLAFSASLIIAPANTDKDKPNYQAIIKNSLGEYSQFISSKKLQTCYQTNPAGKVLALLKLLANSTDENVILPTSEQSHIDIKRCDTE